MPIQSQDLGLQQNYSAPSTPSYGAGDAATDIGGGALSGAAAGATIGSLGGPIGTGAGALIGAGIGLTKAIFSYYGMKRQEEENKRVEGINLGLMAQSRDDRLKAQKWQQDYRKKQMKNQEEINKYNKVMNFVTGFQNQLSRKPQLSTNIINMWNARR